MSHRPRQAISPAVAVAVAVAANAVDADADPDSVDHNSNYDEASDYDNDGNGSLCSYHSGTAAVNNTWRGWRCAQTSSYNAVVHQQQINAGSAGHTADGANNSSSVSFLRRYHMHQAAAATHSLMTMNINTSSTGRVLPLKELSARSVASYLPFEMVDHYNIKIAPVPEELQRKIAFWSFPENEEDIRLYSTLANGSPEQYLLGEVIAKTPGTVQNMLQIGFHLTAAVQASPAVAASSSSAAATNSVALPSPRQYDVSMTFDRKRITTCSCTCSLHWCEHIVAVCLARVRYADKLVLRPPISESLYRLDRTQLHKAFQYFVNELPRHVLPLAQRVLDDLLTPQSNINKTHGAPDPTAGPSANDISSWWYELGKLRNTIKALLYKFCMPSPTVYSDVGYLSASQSTAAAEWSSLMRSLRGREPEGLWNLLGIVREMLRRGDNNATPLLRTITDECLNHLQVPFWWFNIRTSHYYGGSGGSVRSIGTGSGSSSGNSSSATQHACASLMDEIANIWRLVALNPTFTDQERLQLLQELVNSHDKIFGLVVSARQQHANSSINDAVSGIKSIDIAVFTGFRGAVEAALVDWHGFSLCDDKLMYLSMPAAFDNNTVFKKRAAGLVKSKPRVGSHNGKNVVSERATNKRLERKKRTGKTRLDADDGEPKRTDTKLSINEVVKERANDEAGDGLAGVGGDGDAKSKVGGDVHTEITEIGDTMKLPKKHVCGRHHEAKRRGGLNRATALGRTLAAMVLNVFDKKEETESADQTSKDPEPSADTAPEQQKLDDVLKAVTLELSESDTDNVKSDLILESDQPANVDAETAVEEKPHSERASRNKENKRRKERKRRNKAAKDDTANVVSVEMGIGLIGDHNITPAVPFSSITEKIDENLPTIDQDDKNQTAYRNVEMQEIDVNPVLPIADKRASKRKNSKHQKPGSSSVLPAKPSTDTNVSQKDLIDQQALAIVNGSKFLPDVHKPTDKLEVFFMRAEALYSHGFAQASLHLSAQLARQLLRELNSVTTTAGSAVAIAPKNTTSSPMPSMGTEEMQRLTLTAANDVNIADASASGAVVVGNSISSSNVHTEVIEANRQPDSVTTETNENTVATHPPTKTKSVRIKALLSSASHSAYSILSKIMFFVQVLADDPTQHYDALMLGLQGLMLARPAATSRALEVRLSSLEQDLLQLMKQRWADTRSNMRLRGELRKLAELLRKGELKSRGAALVPLSLANYLFDQLVLQPGVVGSGNEVMPVVSALVSRRRQAFEILGDDETLGFEAALAALGQKAAISESDYPLVCEGTRRQRGELALLMLSHYRDNERRLARILDRFLDRDVYSIFRYDQPLGFSSAVGEVRVNEHMMSTSYRTSRPPATITNVLERLFAFHAQTMLPTGMFWHMPMLYKSISSGGGLYTMQETDAGGSGGTNAAAKRATFLHQGSMPFAGPNNVAAAQHQRSQVVNPVPSDNVMPLCDASGSAYLLCSAEAVTTDMQCLTSNHKPVIFVMPPCRSHYVDFYCSLNCGGMPIDVVLGMAQQPQYLGSSCSSVDLQQYHNDFQRQNQPVLHHSLSASNFLHQFPASTGSSTNASSSVAVSAAPSPLQQQPPPPVFSAGRKGKPKPFSLPNRPSDALAYFMFEFAKTLLAKAGGSPINSIFHVAPNHNNGVHHRVGQNAIHRGLQMCAFQIALYALGVNNRVTPNWLQRTYFSGIAWLQTQAVEIGTVAINFLTQTWEGHMTPTEAATTADLVSRSADREVVRAAAYLAQSTLVHANNIARQELQRALDQCAEQSHEMLEESLLCIEASARVSHAVDGVGVNGVSPEVLFDVARRWYGLYCDGKRGYDADNPARTSRNLPRRAGLGYRQKLQPNSHYQPHAGAARVDDDDGQYGSGNDDDNEVAGYSDDGDSDAFNDENEGQISHQDFVFAQLQLKSLWNKTPINLTKKRNRRRHGTLAYERSNSDGNAGAADSYNAWRNMSRCVATTSSRTSGDRTSSPTPIQFALQLGLQASPTTDTSQQNSPSDRKVQNDNSKPRAQQPNAQMPAAAYAAFYQYQQPPFQQHGQMPPLPFSVSNAQLSPQLFMPPTQQAYAVSQQLPVALMPAQQIPMHINGVTVNPNFRPQQTSFANGAPYPIVNHPAGLLAIPSLLPAAPNPNSVPTQPAQQYVPRFIGGPFQQQAVAAQPPSQVFPQLSNTIYACTNASAMDVMTQQKLAESMAVARHRFQAAVANARALMVPTSSSHGFSQTVPASPYQVSQYQHLPYNSVNAAVLPFVTPQPQTAQQLQNMQAHQAFIASLASAANSNHAARVFSPFPLPSPASLLMPLNNSLLARYSVSQQQQPIYPPGMFPQVSAANQMHPLQYPMLNPTNVPAGMARATVLSPPSPMLPSSNNAAPTRASLVPNSSNGQNNTPPISIPRYFTGQDKHLLAAYRVGMVAMETLTRRIFVEERFHLKYHKIKSPFSQEALWLLEKVVKKLGLNFVPYFIADVLEAVASPFVLFRIAYESALYLAAAERCAAPPGGNNNNSDLDAAVLVRKQFNSTILGQLMCKCIQMFQQCLLQKIHHITPNDYDEFVDTVQWAQMVYYIMPNGHAQFQLLLKVIKGHPSCKRELWGKVTTSVAQFHTELTPGIEKQFGLQQQQQQFMGSAMAGGVAMGAVEGGVRQRFENRFNSSTGASAGSSAD